MSLIDDIQKRLQGRDPEKEKRVSEQAAAAKRKYEADVGATVPEEAGINELDFEEVANIPLPHPEGTLMGAAPPPGVLGAARGGSSVASKLRGKMPAKSGSVWHKPPTAPQSAVEKLQNAMHAEASKGTAQGDIRAKELLEEIRKLRDPQLR